MSALLENLRRICGDANVLTHDDPQTDLSAWEQDWRKRSHGRALAGKLFHPYTDLPVVK
jgi:hypothetical protein